jgi:hypothetical protein
VVHYKAHEAAMSMFEAVGYYQPAIYNEEEYQTAFDRFVQRATGTQPPKARARGGDGAGRGRGGGQPKQYMGDKEPQGFPGARRGPRGGWYIQKKGKWYPVLEGKEQSPAAPPDRERAPGRKPMDKERQTADNELEIQASGINLTPEQRGRVEKTGVRSRGKKKVYRGTAPPPDYPDAQYDRDEGAWYYFDDQKQDWRKVMI